MIDLSEKKLISSMDHQFLFWENVIRNYLSMSELLVPILGPFYEHVFFSISGVNR